MGTHRTLKAWQHARLLAIECARAARGFPPEEQSALADQLRRAAYGAVLNITEGAARKGAREFRRYLDVARASLHELDTILSLSRELGYIRPQTADRLEQLRDEAARTVYGLLRSVSAAT